MFYDQLLKLCEIKGIKPTPLVKSLGMSTGSIKNWKEGTLPNGEALMRFSDFFGVSIDYLVYGKETTNIKPHEQVSVLSEDETDLLTYFRRLQRKDQRAILVQMENIINQEKEQAATKQGKYLA